MKIHPTAIVDPGAQLGTEVEIGAYSIVGPQVVIGEKSIVQSHVVFEGRVRIGTANFIGHGALIGGTPQDLAFKATIASGVNIGDRNVIRELCTIHRGTAEGSATDVGDDNFLMAGAHLGHNCKIGSRVIIANNCLLGGYVRVDDGAFLGGGAVFHQFIRVGRLAIVQGQSGFSKDIPPFLIAAGINHVVGVNVIGLRRAGFAANARDEIKAAFKLLYLSGLSTGQALEKSASPRIGSLGREFFDFVAKAKNRGICSYRRGEEIGE